MEPYIGIDESGKGDFFGPLVVSAVFIESDIIANKLKNIGVRDSKLIKNDEKIIKIFYEFKKIIDSLYDVIYIMPKKYNDMYLKIKNLNEILKWAHRKVLTNLLNKLNKNKIECKIAISDKFSIKGIKNKNDIAFNNIKIIEENHAESNYIGVAAASIIAKKIFIEKLNTLSKMINITLTKGSCKNTLNLVKKILLERDDIQLNMISKSHFKTLSKAKLENSQLMVL